MLPTGHLLIEVSQPSAEEYFLAAVILEIIFFYLGDMGEMEESHGYNSAVLHSEQEACSER